MSDSKPPSIAPVVKAEPPPRTKSGELAAVRDFQKEVEKYNDETVPKLDQEVDRMTELLKSVTPTPSVDPDAAPVEKIPLAPRTPSMIDEEEKKGS